VACKKSPRISALKILGAATLYFSMTMAMFSNIWHYMNMTVIGIWCMVGFSFYLFYQKIFQTATEMLAGKVNILKTFKSDEKSSSMKINFKRGFLSLTIITPLAVGVILGKQDVDRYLYEESTAINVLKELSKKHSKALKTKRIIARSKIRVEGEKAYYLLSLNGLSSEELKQDGMSEFVLNTLESNSQNYKTNKVHEKVREMIKKKSIGQPRKLKLAEKACIAFVKGFFIVWGIYLMLYVTTQVYLDKDFGQGLCEEGRNGYY
jgi:hypothetical protein